MGLPNIKVTKGDILFRGKSLLGILVDERARKGIGIGFQHPPAIDGIMLRKLLEIINSSQAEIKRIALALKLGRHLERDLNKGFSGGEVKACEIMQLFLQNPDLVLLDEPDSGVDIENIKVISKAIRELLQMNLPIGKRKRSAIIITHGGNILNYLDTDVGHVMIDGKLKCGADSREIFSKIKKCGYRDCYKCLSANGEKPSGGK